MRYRLRQPQHLGQRVQGRLVVARRQVLQEQLACPFLAELAASARHLVQWSLQLQRTFGGIVVPDGEADRVQHGGVLSHQRDSRAQAVQTAFTVVQVVHAMN